MQSGVTAHEISKQSVTITFVKLWYSFKLRGSHTSLNNLLNADPNIQWQYTAHYWYSTFLQNKVRKEWHSCVEITQTQQMQHFQEISRLSIFIPEWTDQRRLSKRSFHCSSDRQQKGLLRSCFGAALRPSMHIHFSSVKAVPSLDNSWAFPCHVAFALFSSQICPGWYFPSANNFNNTLSFMRRR